MKARTADSRRALQIVADSGGVPLRRVTHGVIYRLTNGQTLLVGLAMNGRGFANFESALRRKLAIS